MLWNKTGKYFQFWKIFRFVNVAPQWQSFNGRNWATFEDDCRQFAISRNLDLEVYTGTSGVIELRDVQGDLVPIYLYNRDQLPVPRFVQQLIIATAFLIIGQILLEDPARPC